MRHDRAIIGRGRSRMTAEVHERRQHMIRGDALLGMHGRGQRLDDRAELRCSCDGIGGRAGSVERHPLFQTGDQVEPASARVRDPVDAEGRGIAGSCPDVHALVRQGEIRRRDSDDRIRASIQHDRAADRAGIARERGFPEAIADQDDRTPMLRRQREAPGRQVPADGFEEIAGDVSSVY